jgi:hypothetical protein
VDRRVTVDDVDRFGLRLFGNCRDLSQKVWMNLRVRPIHHRTAERVPAHIFLCLLACYVEWHLRRVWAPILFEDEERREQRELVPNLLASFVSGLQANEKIGSSARTRIWNPSVNSCTQGSYYN